MPLDDPQVFVNLLRKTKCPNHHYLIRITNSNKIFNVGVTITHQLLQQQRHPARGGCRGGAIFVPNTALGPAFKKHAI